MQNNSSLTKVKLHVVTNVNYLVNFLLGRLRGVLKMVQVTRYGSRGNRGNMGELTFRCSSHPHFAYYDNSLLRIGQTHQHTTGHGIVFLFVNIIILL